MPYHLHKMTRRGPGASEGLPSVLHVMAQDLTTRHVLKQLDGDLACALEQAASPYSFVREQALLSICTVLNKAALARRPSGLSQRLLDAQFSAVAAAILDTIERFQERQQEEDTGPSVCLRSLADGELEAGMQAMQAMVLIHKQSRALFIDGSDAIAQLLHLLPQQSGSCVSVMLDVLLTLQISSPTAQAQFTDGYGFQQVADLHASNQLSSGTKQHCLDVLALLLQCVHPQPPAKSAMRQIEKVLGKSKSSDILNPKAVQMDASQDISLAWAVLLEHP